MGKKGNQLERSENQHLKRISICILKQNKRVFFYGKFVSITRIIARERKISYILSIPLLSPSKEVGVEVASSTIVQLLVSWTNKDS